MKFTRTKPSFTTTDIRRHRPLTRTDFRQVCAYCFRHEDEAGGEAHFVQDHFEPKHRSNVDPADYFNLYWSCGACNAPQNKGPKWPTPDQAARGECFCDPCDHDPVGTDYVENADWTLTSLTPSGDYTIRHIRLNDRASLTKCRKKRTQIKSTYQNLLRMLRGALDAWRNRLAERPTEEARESCDSLHELVEAYELFLARDPFMLYDPLPPEIPQQIMDAITPFRDR